MTTNLSSLSAQRWEEDPSHYSKNSESPKEEPVAEEIKFWKFKELPVEIRLMIWKDVCFEPRIVDVWGKPLSHLCHSNHSLFFRQCPFVYRSHSTIPSILHVSTEARTAGLKHYSLGFGISWYFNYPVLDTRPGQIYVNWSCDIIYPITYHPNPTFMWARLYVMQPQIQNIVLADYNAELRSWDHKQLYSKQKMVTFKMPPGFSVFRLKSKLNGGSQTRS
jgi:hypothetical protein